MRIKRHTPRVARIGNAHSGTNDSCPKIDLLREILMLRSAAAVRTSNPYRVQGTAYVQNADTLQSLASSSQGTGPGARGPAASEEEPSGASSKKRRARGSHSGPMRTFGTRKNSHVQDGGQEKPNPHSTTV